MNISIDFFIMKSMTTDVCVPLSQLPEMLVQTQKDIDESGITGGQFWLFCLTLTHVFPIVLN